MAKGKFTVGPGAKKLGKNYADQELKYANRGFFLEFYHVPSGKMVQFKAILTSYQDKFDSEWTSTSVYGRNDPIQNFQGTKRSIDIGWDVVAANWGEAKDNLQRCSLLNSMLYPSYDIAAKNAGLSTISAAPLFKLAFANLIKNQAPGGGVDISEKATINPEPPVQKNMFEADEPIVSKFYKSNVFVDKNRSGGAGSAKYSGLVGTVSGFAFAPELSSGFFDPKQAQGSLFPKLIKLSCTFTVIHTHPLGWSGSNFRNGSFPYGEPTAEISRAAKKSVNKTKKNNKKNKDNSTAAQAKKIFNKLF
jgi:hypothetical protein